MSYMQIIYILAGICCLFLLLFLCMNGLGKFILCLIRDLIVNPIIYMISCCFCRCSICHNAHHGNNRAYYTNKNLCGNASCQHLSHGTSKCSATKVITSWQTVEYIELIPTQVGTREETLEQNVRKCVGTEYVQAWKDVPYTDNESYTDYESRTVYSYSSTNTTTQRVPVTKTRSVTKTRRESYMKSVPKMESVCEYTTIQVPIYEGTHEETKVRSVPIYTNELCTCENTIENNNNSSCCAYCTCCWCHREGDRRPLLG